MSWMRGLAFRRLPQELGTQPPSGGTRTTAASIAQDLAEAADGIAALADWFELTPDEREQFLVLAQSLRQDAVALRNQSARARRSEIRSTMEHINSTCIQCHELFRDPSSPPVNLAAVSPGPGIGDLARQVGDVQRLTGDWGGRRSILEENGARINLFYNQLGARKGEGGASLDPVTRASGSSDLIAQVDFGQMGLIRGGEALLHAKGDWSPNVNPAVGALGDPLDDADSDRVFIDQLWYQHNFRDRLLQLRLGYLDQQTILDRNAFANIEDLHFANTFLDNNSAIIPLAIGPGAALFVNPTNWLSFVATVSDAEARPLRLSLDTAFTGKTFTYFETDLRSSIASSGGPLEGNYRFGFFLDPRQPGFVAAGEGPSRNKGAYASFDQWLFVESADPSQGLGVFARLGWRPSRLNRVSRSYSAGAQYAGAIAGRPRDVVGLAFYSVVGSDLFRAQVDPTFSSEAGYEAYYAFRFAPAVTLTPAYQHITRPGAVRTRRAANVAALRLRLIL